METKTRQCSKCGVVKPLSEFCYDQRRPLGVGSHCKSCHSAYGRKWHQEHPDTSKAHLRNRVNKWRQANHGRYLDYSRNRYAERPEIGRAHAAVRRSIKNGTLVKQPCAVCGSEDSESHHDDYSKPLEVIWLCGPHHWLADEARRAREATAGNTQAGTQDFPQTEVRMSGPGSPTDSALEDQRRQVA